MKKVWKDGTRAILFSPTPAVGTNSTASARARHQLDLFADEDQAPLPSRDRDGRAALVLPETRVPAAAV
jgi:hypothetical protein